MPPLITGMVVWSLVPPVHMSLSKTPNCHVKNGSDPGFLPDQVVICFCHYLICNLITQYKLGSWSFFSFCLLTSDFLFLLQTLKLRLKPLLALTFLAGFVRFKFSLNRRLINPVLSESCHQKGRSITIENTIVTPAQTPKEHFFCVKQPAMM